MNKIAAFTLPQGSKNFSVGDFQDAFVPELLQSILRAYKNDDTKYIWKKIFPEVSVKKVTGKIANIGMQAMSIKGTKRAFKGGINKIEFGVQLDDEWNLQQQGLYTDIYKSDIENADTPIDAQRDKMFILNGVYDLSKEAACISQVFSTAVITNNVALSSADRFDTTTSDPVAILYAQAKLLKDTCGSRPSLIVISLDAMVAMTNNQKVIDRFKYTVSPTIPELQAKLAAVMSTEIVVHEAQQWDGTGGIEGTLTYLTTAKVLMIYNEGAGMYTKGFGKTFTRNGGKRVMTVPYTPTEQVKLGLDSLVAVEDEYDMHIVDQKCVRLITTVIGS